MRKVEFLITGASGWLGRGLLNALIFGLDSCPNLLRLSKSGLVRVLIMPGESLELLDGLKDRVEVVFGDVRNPLDCDEFMKGSQRAILLHTAGIIHPNKITDFYDVNVRGTSNVLLAAEKAGIKRAVVVSSNSPMGCNSKNSELFDETSPFNPYMNYGKSKMLMEQNIVEFQKHSKLETVRIRAPWFYGPFQPARQTLFFEMIRDGKVPIVGNGENKRSMAYIDNLCQGVILAANSSLASGKVYWIADERPYSMNEIIDTIEDVMISDFSIKCSGKRMHLPGMASEVAYFLDKFIQSMGIYNQKIHVLSEMNKTIACSVELAKRELGYSPQVELREGMKRSIQWMLNGGVRL